MFKITRDILTPGLHGSIANTYWGFPPRPQFEEAKKAFNRAPKMTFRLLDDDGEVYFHGQITKAQYNQRPTMGHADAFEPLDIMQPSYGCTSIQYREGNRWVSL